MKTLVFKGNLKCGENKNQQVIDINMPHNGLSIRGLTKEVLDLDKSFIPDDNGVYVLESEDICYVGQSKNLRERLKNHFANNKINHNRIFFLHSKSDVRGYLDYMEKRLYKSMKEEGYELANGTSLDPDQDRLDSDEKKIVDVWIAEFLAFLPILGFRKEVIKKSLLTLENNENEEDEKLSIEKKKVELFEESERLDLRLVLIEELKKLRLEEIMCLKGFISSSVDIRSEKFKARYSNAESRFFENDFGEVVYYALNISRNNLMKKIERIKNLKK